MIFLSIWTIYTTWHKRFFVLRDESTDRNRRLEMFSKEAEFVKGGEAKFVLDLANVVHVGRTADSKRFRQAFLIVCVNRSPVLLADVDSLSLNSWLLAVNLIAEKDRLPTPGPAQPTTNGVSSRHGPRKRSNELPDCLEGVPLDQFYSDMKIEDSSAEKFEVSIETTEASRRNGIRGDFVLMVHSWGVSLQKSGKEDCAIHWPLCFIRKYKNEMLGLSPKRKTTLVTLELGRRCSTGEGIFKFRTQYGREIVTEMTQVISSSMNRKMAVEGVLSSSKMSTGHLPLGNSTNSYRGPWCQENETGWWVGGAVSPPDRPASLYSTGSESRHEHSRSSSDSAHLHRGVLRSGSAKLPAMNESTSSVSSSASASSGESAEYIMASFSEKAQRLQFDTRNVLRASRSTNDIAAYLTTPLGALSREEMQRQRIARAEAEGYLEVLPDYYDGEKASEERSNIYHNMDFTNNDKTMPETNTGETDECTAAVDTGAQPTTSTTTATTIRSSPNPSRKKPPAPLPRPEHTMGASGDATPVAIGSFFRRPLNHVLSPPVSKFDFSTGGRSPEPSNPSSPPSAPTSPLNRAPPMSPNIRAPLPPKCEVPSDPQYECVLIGPLSPMAPLRSKPPILPKPETGTKASVKDKSEPRSGGGAPVSCPRLEPTVA